MTQQVPNVKPEKPQTPTQLSSTPRVDLSDTSGRPDGLREVIKELVDTRWGRQR